MTIDQSQVSEAQGGRKNRTEREYGRRMSDRVTALHIDVDYKGGRQIGATVFLPDRDALGRHPPVLLCLPGAGYNRDYFDLPEQGYSQARFHAANGYIVLALDHLGTGESSIPPAGDGGYRDVAHCNHLALQTILARLKSGDIANAGPVDPGPVVGVGHSMGGQIAVVMQAAHRSFDGLASLGASMVSVRLPSTTPWEYFRLPAGADPATMDMSLFSAVDWRLIGHWDDVPPHLVEADEARAPLGIPPPWRSATLPNVGGPMQLATVAAEAAAIDVPVLIGVGERDTCHDMLREMAMFPSARDISFIEVPRMAHLHNFAGTRAVMWRRVEAFAQQLAMMAD